MSAEQMCNHIVLISGNLEHKDKCTEQMYYRIVLISGVQDDGFESSSASTT